MRPETSTFVIQTCVTIAMIQINLDPNFTFLIRHPRRPVHLGARKEEFDHRVSHDALCPTLPEEYLLPTLGSVVQCFYSESWFFCLSLEVNSRNPRFDAILQKASWAKLIKAFRTWQRLTARLLIHKLHASTAASCPSNSPQLKMAQIICALHSRSIIPASNSLRRPLSSGQKWIVNVRRADVV